MTDQNQNPPLDTTVNNMLTMFRNQMSNVSNLVEHHAGLVSEALNTDVSQYNNLIEALEESDKKLSDAELKAVSLKEELEEREIKHKEQLSAFQTELTQLKLKLSTWKELKAELNRFKEMDPDGMKDRLARSKKLAEERLDALNVSKRENRSYRKERASDKERISTLENAALMATQEIERLLTQVARQDGEVVNMTFKGKDGLECFIYLYHWGLSFTPSDGAIRTVKDMDFHVVVRTTVGINLSVSCSDWFVPFLPSCKELEGRVPQAIYPKLTELFTDLLGKTHPFLLERIEWAKEAMISDLDVLTQKQIDLLEAANFFSIYSLAHVTDETLAQRVKGLSVKSATAIRNKIHEEVVKPWCVDNWPKEQVRAYT